MASIIQWSVLGLVLSVVLTFVTGGFTVKAHGNFPFKFSADQRATADQIISVFENNTPELQYGYTEVLGDGRGVTAGRAGFTSATGDMYEVVKRYSKINPDHGLSRMLPTLKGHLWKQTNSVADLGDIHELWLEASYDERFRKIQDTLVDELYYFAALEKADEIGAHYPLTLLVLYDTAIQHGNGTDKDGLSAIIKSTNKEVWGTPDDGINENWWIRNFLENRREILVNPHNKATGAVWAESAPRVDTLMQMLNQENYYLDQPLTIYPWGTYFTLIEEKQTTENTIED